MNIFDNSGELQKDAVDVLYELGNMGVATAVMTIGNIRGIEIHVDMPNVITVTNNIFSEINFEPEQVMIAVTTKLDNTLKGSILFLLSKKFIRNTLYQMTDVMYSDEEMLKDEESVSAIQEIINYMTAGYAKVIGAYLNEPIYISSAKIGMDKAKNILHDMIENEDRKTDKIACVNTMFSIVDEDGNKTDETGQVLIFPHEQSIKKFIDIMEK